MGSIALITTPQKFQIMVWTIQFKPCYNHKHIPLETGALHGYGDIMQVFHNSPPSIFQKVKKNT